LGFRVLGFGALGLRFRIQDSGFRVQGLWLMAQDSGFRVQGSGFRVWGLCVRFGVWSLRFRV
jgi:hypothetical protein